MMAMRAAPIALAWLCALTSARAAPTHSHMTLPAPPDLLARVEFEQRLGAQVPLDLVFRDTQGATLRLRAVLAGKAALLIPGYYGCRNLCDVVRAGVAQAVSASGLIPGEQFNVVLVSIDPRESALDAAAAQRSDALAHPTAWVPRWRYLVAAPAASAALARAIGFRYFFDPRNGQYAHAAGVVVVSPTGGVTQYLFGVKFAPLTLRLALINASQGRIGSLVDRLVLLCCAYDAATGRYSLLISRVLLGMGVLTLLTLGALIVALRCTELRARASGAPS